MFDRFIRLQRARKALRDQRFEDALQFVADPLIRSRRQAADIRDRARDKLLERAHERLAAGDLRAARALFGRLTSLADNEQVRAFGRDLDSEEEAAREVGEAAREALEEARRLMARGDLEGAAAAVAAMPDGGLTVQRQRFEQQLDESRRQVTENLAAIAEHLRGDRIDAACEAYQRVLALDRDAALQARTRPKLAQAMADQAAVRMAARIAAGDLAGACDVLRTATSNQACGDLAPYLDEAVTRLHAALLDAVCGTADLPAALQLAAMVRSAGIAVPESLAVLFDVLARVAAIEGNCDPALARELQQAAKAAGADRLGAVAAALVEQQDGFESRLKDAATHAARGDLDTARQQLTQILAEDPMHEAARRELELIEQGAAELTQRLDAARTAAREGRLRDACAAALTLGTAGRLGADAQLLLTDVRARMTLVDRGVEEILGALHGRAAGSLQGVRHCLARLEELAKVQSDHQELSRVIAAVGAEIEGLEACDRCGTALDDGALAEVVATIDVLLAVRPRMLTPERLDARALTLADRLSGLAGQAVAKGRDAELEPSLLALERLAVVNGEFATHAERLRSEAAGRRAGAEERAAAAGQQLEQRDLAAAEGMLEEARELWADAAGVRALSERLRELRQQSDAIDEVAALAKGRDYRGAADKLADMPPTSPMLRTRIFDMKQQLARAQGLETAFLLRVDEGGEHLVVRGESVSIGNMRQKTADLPILANVAGRHATIRRSMSFHGGMEDTVVAEDGEVRVGGEPVRSQRLSPGDRIELGPSLVASYERPSRRSLTAGLVLQGGFQIAGTERILLMKDRGKDGRILIGSAPDVHVRVAAATEEVEIFATSTGQVRVGCAGGGEIDGVAFRGEHPVDAGQVVSAAGITFIMLPWSGA